MGKSKTKILVVIGFLGAILMFDFLIKNHVNSKLTETCLTKDFQRKFDKLQESDNNTQNPARYEK